MSSFIAKLKNPKTGKLQKAFCIDDFYGPHKYGYGFLKDNKDANFHDKFDFDNDCDFYEESDIDYDEF